MRQFLSAPPKKILLLIDLVLTLQIISLLVPPTSDDGYPWNYSQFWPAWCILNGPARPDRMLLLLKVDSLKILYICLSLVGARLTLFTLVAVCLNDMSTKRFQNLLSNVKGSFKVSCLVKVDYLVQIFVSRLFSVPIVSFLMSQLVCTQDCVPGAFPALAAVSLPVSLGVILCDRFNNCNLKWSQNNEGPHLPLTQLRFSVCDLAAAVIVPICTFASHDFLLRLLVLILGLVKTFYVYRDLPFYTRLRNCLEGFQGVMLVWEAVLLTLALNFNETELVPSLLLLLVSPLLFYINLSVVDFMQFRYLRITHIESEVQHEHVLRAAVLTLPTVEETEISFSEDSRLREIPIDSLSLYPLIWTAYYFIHIDKSFALKLILAKLGLKEGNVWSETAVMVCYVRTHRYLELSIEEETMQNFLKLNRKLEKIRHFDYEASIRLQQFYSHLKQPKVEYSKLSTQIVKLHEDMSFLLALYEKAASTFSKKVSLLQAYGSLLTIVGETEKVQKRALRLLQSKKRERVNGINRLLNEDPSCIVMVIQLTGPEANTIIWTMNAALLGYTDDNLKGCNYNIFIPDCFKAKHASLAVGLMKKMEEPKILKTVHELYLLNEQRELVYGMWDVFMTNLKPFGHLLMIATIRIETSPREFAILSPDFSLMESTRNFTHFLKDRPNVTQEINFDNPEKVWTGEWMNSRVLLAREDLIILEHYPLSIVRLHRLSSFHSTRKYSHLPMYSKMPSLKIRTVSFGNEPDETEQLFTKINNKSSHSASNNGSSLSLVDDYVQTFMNKKLKRHKMYSWMIGVSLLVVCVVSTAISISVLLSMINQIDYLNQGISEMNNIGIRRFLGVNSAVRSKELYLINSGFKVIGNEVKCRTDLTTISTMMKQMASNVLGNASEATGYYRELVMDPVMPYWRFEGGQYVLYHLTLFDLMSEIADHATTLITCPVKNVTLANPHFMELYRNGPAETLKNFNHTIDAYTANMYTEKTATISNMTVLLYSAISAELVLAAILSYPFLILMERLRRKIWVTMLHLPKPLLSQAHKLVSERFFALHDVDDQDLSQDSEINNSAGASHYYTSPFMTCLYLSVSVFIVFTSLYVLHIFLVGVLGTGGILSHKPLFINWAGLRRATTQFCLFSMREAWLLHSNSSYLTMVPEDQYRYNPFVHLEKAYTELSYIHQSIVYGNTDANTTNLLPTDAHKDLLFGNPCNGTCDPRLQYGLAPLFNEVLFSFSAARTALLAGETDYAKAGGTKAESEVSLLMPYLSTLVTQYDTDSLNMIFDIQGSAKIFCAVYITLSYCFYSAVLIPLLIFVRNKQNYKRFYKEVSVMGYLPKELLAEALQKKSSPNKT